MSDDAELTESGPARRIFLHALRDFSESCEAPELTPHCPFAIDLEPGVRGCGEECMDLLARHDAPPPVDTTQIAPGVSIQRVRRPRSRRAHLPGQKKPYDAKELFLDESADRPPAQWRLSSLLIAARELLTAPPPALEDERLDTLRLYASLMEGRGLEFRRQVLPNLVPDIAGSITAWAMDESHDCADDPVRAAWETLLTIRMPDPDSGDRRFSRQEFHREFIERQFRVGHWILTASDESLVFRTPPSEIEFAALDSDAPPNGDPDTRWIIERLTSTYVNEWTTTTLHREWRYIHGQYDPPCSPGEVSIRVTDATEIAGHIADRATYDLEDSEQRLQAFRFVGPAIRYLRQGRRQEAVALFEATAEMQPDDPHTQNNLGFCLLPDEPERALKHLNRASTLGPLDSNVTTANRVLCLATLGRYTSALDLARDHLSSGKENSDGAILWEASSILDDGAAPALLEVDDVHSYIHSVAALIAKRSGDPDLHDEWPPND